MILIERNDDVVTVTLNRPEVRNAFDEKTIGEVTDAFAKLAKDKKLRAVVLRGAGTDFCAGADIHWMKRASTYTPAQNQKDATRLVHMCRAIDECAVPVIVRIQGACFGGGLGIVSASDIAVCADSAKLAFSECRLGIIPAVVSSFVIPKIGPTNARRYFLTAETFDAKAALQMGLVHEVAAEAELDARIEKLLQWTLRAGPNAVREAKALIRTVAGLPLDKRIACTIKALARTRSSPEAKEGFAAFLEKRPAAWI